MQNTLLILILNLYMTQSVLNTFNKVYIGVKLWAFYLLKYGIRSFLKHDLD